MLLQHLVDIGEITSHQWSDLFIGVAAIISAVGSAAAAILSARNARKIEEVHKATNGMKDELVQTTGEKRFAEGVVMGASNARYDAGVIQGEDNPRLSLIKRRNGLHELKVKAKKKKVKVKKKTRSH